MAKASQVTQLIIHHFNRNDSGFIKCALEIAEHENKKGNKIFGNRLRHLVDFKSAQKCKTKNPEPSFYQRYCASIWIILAVIISLEAYIAFLK